MSTELFEGREIRKRKIALTNAGDGLSESMEVAPVDIELGDEGYALIAWTCSKVRFEGVTAKDGDVTDEVDRVHFLRAGTALIVDDEFAGDLILAQAAKVAKHKAEQAGQLSLEDSVDGSGEVEELF